MVDSWETTNYRVWDKLISTCGMWEHDAHGGLRVLGFVLYKGNQLPSSFWHIGTFSRLYWRGKALFLWIRSRQHPSYDIRYYLVIWDNNKLLCLSLVLHSKVVALVKHPGRNHYCLNPNSCILFEIQGTFNILVNMQQ